MQSNKLIATDATAEGPIRHPYIALLFRYWAVVLAVTLIGGAGAWGLSQLATPSYKATTTLYFSLNVGNSGNDLNQGSTFALAQMQSYARLAKTSQVLDPVINSLGLTETSTALAGAVDAVVPQNTVMLQLSASDSSPAQAAKIANAVGASLADAVDAIAPRTDKGAKSVRIFQVDPAEAPKSAISPNTRLNVLAGLVLGLIVSVVAILLRRLLDTRVRDEAQLRAATGAAVLGSIEHQSGHHGGDQPGPLLLEGSAHSAGAERYRQLRASLEAAAPNPGTLSLVVTSPRSGDGKSTIAANLAIALAEGGRSVILVDAELRHPSIAALTGLKNKTGFSSVVGGEASEETAIQRWAAGPDVLTSGPLPVTPGAVLNSPETALLIGRLTAQYDAVVIDAPHLIGLADAGVLARLVDGALLVVDSSRAHAVQVREATASLDRSGAQTLGAVLTKVHARHHRESTAPAHEATVTATTETATTE